VLKSRALRELSDEEQELHSRMSVEAPSAAAISLRKKPQHQEIKKVEETRSQALIMTR